LYLVPRKEKFMSIAKVHEAMMAASPLAPKVFTQ